MLKKNVSVLLALVLSLGMTACSSFKAERVDSAASDEKALKITDEWVNADTEQAIKEVVKQIKEHKAFQQYLRQHKGQPTLFVAEVQNSTAEAYFPIGDMNDELLNDLSSSGDYVLVDAAQREKILKEVTYQNDGMVDAKTAKQIGKQTAADLMIFGTVFMKPQTRKGETIKEYTVNLRMTDVEKGVEVLRTRAKIFKYSKQSGTGW